MIDLILLMLLICACNLTSPIFTSSTAVSARFFSIPFSTVKFNLFKGLPKLPIINETAGEIRSVYYYDQLVAVLDIKGGKSLLHCELIEVYEHNQVHEILKNLSTSSKLHTISFKDMLKLMEKCDELDENSARTLNLLNVHPDPSSEVNSLFVGIVPGTKWCGTGDIARNYHDLGPRTKIDRCCRTHDLCPVKIRAYKSRYNLNNKSFFSKSHCNCEKKFYDCLKNISHVSARIIGKLYFNIAQPFCIEDVFYSDKNLRRFVPLYKRF